HEDGAIDRMLAQQLFGLHGEEVAIEHAGRLDELFGQRHRGYLDREPAGLPDAALDLLDTFGEMAVALREIPPRVDDADHRLAEKLLARIPHLQGAGAVTERA